MKKPNNNSGQSAAAKAGFRLIRGGTDQDTPKDPEQDGTAGQKNPFVKFMSAYADSIDKEVQAILDL